MADSTVGITEGPSPTKLIDNDQLTVNSQTVQRQRVNVVPVEESSYKAGTAGSVNIPTTHKIVGLSAYCLVEATVVINGGDTITIPAGGAFSDDLHDAPIVGTGAGTVVFTNTSNYYVRYVPVVS